MEQTIKRMRERIAKLDKEADGLEKEIEQKIEEWKRDAQRIFDRLNNDSDTDSDFDNFALVGDAEEIQWLKNKLNTLQKEILPDAKIIEEWYIADSFVCAIEYGDISGGDFSADEIEAIEDFQVTLATFSPYGCLMWGEESEFEVDHISGKRANCLKAMMILV